MSRLTFLYQMDLPHRAVKDLRKAGLLTTAQRYREKGGKSSLLFRLVKQ